MSNEDDEEEDYSSEEFDPTVIGAEVQFDVEDGVRTGVVFTVDPPKVERTKDWSVWYKLSEEEQDDMLAHALVRCDDGSLQRVSVEELYAQDSELEKEFRTAVIVGGKLIDEQLELAQQAIYKAVRISEEYGIPFRAGVSPLWNTFHPDSLSSKWSGVDDQFIDEITDTYNEYPGEAGWQHSAVC
jgi:hypothetical protein